VSREPRSGRAARRPWAAAALAALAFALAPAGAPPAARAAAPAAAPAATPRPATTAPKPAGSATTRTQAAARPAGAARRAPPPAASRKTPIQLGAEARGLEELGAYAQARETLRALRGRVAPDADLELALALDEARTGQADSAAARLWGRLLSKAVADSMPETRRAPYPGQREAMWINGRFDGWYWYVARARAELAAAKRRWPEARDAARLAVAARERCGKEWLILAVCAGRAGDLDEAARAARAAAWRDPTLPEAQYLAGLFDWRAGRRAAAQQAFRAATALDSSYRAPALALVRSQLPGVPPDSLPVELLTGAREVGLLTSPARPKQEEFFQADIAASILHQDVLALPDSLRGTFKLGQIYLPILVDERGHAVLHELPWSSTERLPDPLLRLTLESLLHWSFSPAIRLGKPQRSWANIRIALNP